MGKVLFLLLRIVCYVALAVVSGSILALVTTVGTGACKQGNGGSIACESEALQSVIDVSYSVLLATVFTDFPALFALGGIFFLIRAIVLKADARRNAARAEAGFGPETATTGGAPAANATGTSESQRQPPSKTWRIAKTVVIVIACILVGLIIIGIIAGDSGSSGS